MRRGAARRAAVRAHTPAPGAWTQLGEARLKLGPVLAADDAPLPAGTEPGRLAPGAVAALAVAAGALVPLAFSGGFAEHLPGAALSEAARAADRAMYEEKRRFKQHLL